MLFECEIDFLAHIPIEINLMIFLCDFMLQVWSCCHAFFCLCDLLGELIYQFCAFKSQQ